MKIKNDNSIKAVDILQECFHNFNAEEGKELLWQLFSLTVSGGFCNQPVAVRENLTDFYVHLQKVLEAAGDLISTK